MNVQMKEENKKVKRIFEMLGIKYIDYRDKKIINYVSGMLDTINIKTGAYTGTVNYNSAIAGSLENLKVLGMEPYFKVSSFISTIPFYMVNPNRNGYACHITYSLDDETFEIDKSSGTIACYKVPQRPDILAPLHLGHEHIHALKETNYEEYIDGQILGDVIPIFYELLMSDKYEETKKMIMLFRISSLKEDKKHYDNAISQMSKKDLKDLYKVVATRSGQYLNSFYYSLLLYNLYKREPKKVLELVNKVLNHEMTTRGMLEELGLLYSDGKDIFEEEFDAIRKVLK